MRHFAVIVAGLYTDYLLKQIINVNYAIYLRRWRVKKKEKPQIDEKLKKYPKTDLLEIVDTIPTKHPYSVGPRHVGHVADNFNGILSKEAILDGEKKGIYCTICKGKLSYEEHKQALLLAVDSDLELPDFFAQNPKEKEFLISLKDQCEADEYAGFAFIKRKDWENVRNNCN